MVHTDLKFFTNEPERDLYTRFTKILQGHTQFFDVLVGYFRTSGFFKLYPALENVEKIRILVGLNTDKFTVKIIDRAKEEIQYATFTEKEGREAVEDQIQNEFETAVTSSEVEKGVRVFIDWLKNGKLEMRMYTEAPVHAKVYIMRKDPDQVPDQFGSVITGSSNFSTAGLMNNLEFNVELKDAADVQFALDKFEELWEKSVDIKDTYIDTVEQKTWMRGDITPYELYLKTLYEFFKEEINADKENFQTLLPDGYMRLQYQLDAVMQAKQKIEAYNGVFISDVVGLGKTYICAMLANTFPRATYKLFICPPVLVSYWQDVLKEFDVARWDVISLGKLDQLIQGGDIDKYSYVFIDEAHRFRNSNTENYTNLHQICRGKKVVLISATPINNYNSDIENQIYLFQSKQSGTINGIKNIEGFFRGLNSRLNSIPKGTQKYIDVLRENAEIIRDKLLREVMIRRTRGEIEQYYKDDMEKQGLTFPKVGSPEKIIYTFDEYTDSTFTETVAVIKDFRYSRYMPLTYLKTEIQKRPDIAVMVVGQRNMGGFMKGILVKRLESSFYAFRMTLERFISSYEKFITMAKSGKVYISKKVDVYDLLDDGDIDKLMYYVEQNDVMEFNTVDFTPKFLRDLEGDLSSLKSLRDMWGIINTDPKLNEFKKALTTDGNMLGKKIIVFTESKETAEYLYDNLQKIYGSRIIYFSGQSSQQLKVQIEDSFNPKNKSKNNDRFDLLITTDVLAEGINLHRANVLVNYDLPWNPTRIMQRVGRINRVGSEFDRIFVYNFFPTAQTAAHLPLEERILEKLQAFHDTLGEDIKYLSDEEEISSKKLFQDLNSDMDGEEESTNPELAYLAIIRQIRDNDPQLFNKIKRLPRKAKAGKYAMLVDNTATVGFIRKGALKTFFLSDDADETKHLTFMEAIKYIQAEPDDEKISVGSNYYDHYDKNSTAFDEYLMEEDTITTEKAAVTGNDAKVIKLLRAMKNEPTFTDDQEEKLDILIERWEAGEIPSKVSKDIVKRSKQPMADLLEFYYDIIKIVPPSYMEEKQRTQIHVDGEKQVILSCYLKNGGNRG